MKEFVDVYGFKVLIWLQILKTIFQHLKDMNSAFLI